MDDKSLDDDSKHPNTPKHQIFHLNHNVLATVESTRTILGLIQSPISFAQVNSSLLLPETAANNSDRSPACVKFNKSRPQQSYNSFEDDTENLSPPKSQTSSSEYDTERTRRIVCENTIESLQEKILSMEQENAVLKLEKHKKDIELRKLHETLNQVKYSWKNTEDYLSSITKSHTILQKDLNEAKMLNSSLAQQLSSSKYEIESLKRSEHELKVKCDTELTKFPLEIENLKKKLEKYDEAIVQYQKDIHSYQTELFKVQKENQDIIRAKVKLETDNEGIISKLHKTIRDIEQTNEDYKNQIGKLQSEMQNLTEINEKLRKEINNLTLEKDNLEIDLRKADASKIAQDVENLATLKKTISDKEAEFDEYRNKLALLKSEEMENLKSRYESIVQEMQNQHKIQVNDLLNKIKECESDKTQSLSSINEELKLAKDKIEKLKSGRNKILSRLQIHLQNQWKESVNLLYADEEEEDNDNFIKNASNFHQNSKANWLNNPNELFNTPKSTKQDLAVIIPELEDETKMFSNQRPTLTLTTPKYSPLNWGETQDPKTPQIQPKNSEDQSSTSKCDSETLQRYIKMLLQENVSDDCNEEFEPRSTSLETIETKQNEVSNKTPKTSEKSPPWK